MRFRGGDKIKLNYNKIMISSYKGFERNKQSVEIGYLGWWVYFNWKVVIFIEV